jgi:hypothetical protein
LPRAWDDSKPGPTGGHEEGGFVLRDRAGDLTVIRWPQGFQNSILLSPHPECRIGERHIVATFHTHPNTGSGYLQEPGDTDRRAVRDDPDLKGEYYVGEFVISHSRVYLIAPNGQVTELGDRMTFLG